MDIRTKGVQESATAAEDSGSGLRAEVFRECAERYFDEFDKNRDGRLSPRELEDAEIAEQAGSQRELVRQSLTLHACEISSLPPNGFLHIFNRAVTRERLNEFDKLQRRKPEDQLVKDINFSVNKTRREQLVEIADFIRTELKKQHPKGLFSQPEIDKELLGRIANDPTAKGKRHAIAAFLQDNLDTFANLASFGPPPHYNHERTHFDKIRYSNLDQLNDVITFHQMATPTRTLDENQDRKAPVYRSVWSAKDAVHQLQTLTWPAESFK